MATMEQVAEVLGLVKVKSPALLAFEAAVRDGCFDDETWTDEDHQDYLDYVGR